MPLSLHLEATVAIQDLFLRYAASVDRGDWETVRGCFIDDAIWGERTNAQMIADSIRDASERRTWQQHFIGNVQVVELEGETARATANLIATWTTASRPEARIIFGVYHDRLMKTSDGWKVAERRLEAGFSGLLTPGTQK